MALPKRYRYLIHILYVWRSFIRLIDNANLDYGTHYHTIARNTVYREAKLALTQHHFRHYHYRH